MALDIRVIDHVGCCAGRIHSTEFAHRVDHSEASVLKEWRRQQAISDPWLWTFEHGKRAARLELVRDGIIMEVKDEPHAQPHEW